MMNDLISIIVPAYNVAPFIKRCINSITAQTYQNLEIIIVNDGSTDHTPEIISQLQQSDPRIQIINQQNFGVSTARNTGVKNASGNWLAFVDADDTIEKDFCQKMLSHAISERVDYVCSGYCRIFPRHTEVYNVSHNQKVLTTSQFIKLLLSPQAGYGFVHMKLIKTKIAKTVAFDQSLKVGEDTLYNIQLVSRIKKIAILEEPLYNYFVNQNSVVKKWDQNYIDKYLFALQKTHNYLLQSFGRQYLQASYNYISYHVFLILVNYCCHPNNKHHFSSIRTIYKDSFLRTAIKKSNYQNLSLSRKITLLALKLKLYPILFLIGHIRQNMSKTC